ncbi:hypothetical protein Dda_6901 [Drechslerella dactyloides]|uniref:C2H2-type domain-containing protein n=1 Tax=Drechslerella dactyloides TaxID=74499 RepID=A0AAD6ITY7_DREDA|nr:hypothetical protein Dda_6901 [Drechslerella dactyloides]
MGAVSGSNNRSNHSRKTQFTLYPLTIIAVPRIAIIDSLSPDLNKGKSHPPQKKASGFAQKPEPRKTCEICQSRKATKTSGSIQHCSSCDDYFPSAPFTCLDCQEDFYDESIFEGHLAEHGAIRRHTDLSTLMGKATNPSTKKIFICPGCKKDFASKNFEKDISALRDIIASGLINHLESGACKSGYNRNTINHLICESDIRGFITLLGAKEVLEDYNFGTSLKGIDEEEALSIVSDWSSDILLTPSGDGSELSFEVVSGTLDASNTRREDNLEVGISDILGIEPRNRHA